MRRSITLVLCSLVLSLPLMACQEDGYDCTATFRVEQGGEVVSTKDYGYDDANNAEEATMLCSEEAANDKPSNATYFNCECESR